jgi:hypothetical protein
LFDGENEIDDRQNVFGGDVFLQVKLDQPEKRPSDRFAIIFAQRRTGRNKNIGDCKNLSLTSSE